MSETSIGFNFDTVDHMLAEAIEDNDEVMKNIPGVIGGVSILGFQAEGLPEDCFVAFRKRFNEVV